MAITSISSTNCKLASYTVSVKVIVRHYRYHVLDNNNEKLSYANTMHGKFFPAGSPTIGYTCKELQSICSDYDGGSAHSKCSFPNFERS